MQLGEWGEQTYTTCLKMYKDLVTLQHSPCMHWLYRRLHHWFNTIAYRMVVMVMMDVFRTRSRLSMTRSWRSGLSGLRGRWCQIRIGTVSFHGRRPSTNSSRSSSLGRMGRLLLMVLHGVEEVSDLHRSRNRRNYFSNLDSSTFGYRNMKKC